MAFGTNGGRGYKEVRTHFWKKKKFRSLRWCFRKMPFTQGLCQLVKVGGGGGGGGGGGDTL
jgi:hypothetical protein